MFSAMLRRPRPRPSAGPAGPSLVPAAWPLRGTAPAWGTSSTTPPPAAARAGRAESGGGGGKGADVGREADHRMVCQKRRGETPPALCPPLVSSISTLKRSLNPPPPHTHTDRPSPPPPPPLTTVNHRVPGAAHLLGERAEGGGGGRDEGVFEVLELVVRVGLLHLRRGQINQ